MAIGFKLGRDREGHPQENEPERTKAISAVQELYQSFLHEFGATGCKELVGLDFSIPAERQSYVDQKIWKMVCDVCLDFAMNKCYEMAMEDKI